MSLEKDILSICEHPKIYLVRLSPFRCVAVQVGNRKSPDSEKPGW
jgi:hypothetical protein